MEELDAPLAEGVQPAPEPPVVESDNFEPATVFVEYNHDDDGDAHNSKESDVEPSANPASSVSRPKQATVGRVGCSP